MYDLYYTAKDEKLTSLNGVVEGFALSAKLHWMDHTAMPLMNPQFNLTIDH